MPDEVHHFHHDDPRVTVDLKVAHTTRGDTWEVEVKGAGSPTEAVETFAKTKDELAAHITEPKETTK